MKLFDDFEAVRFPEENLIFITKHEYIYYIYNLEYKWWRKHKNAGFDHITVSNYQDVSKEEIMEALGGVFPDKETDFMRCCDLSGLCVWDMLRLMEEDYPRYMSNRQLYNAIHRFLLESDIRHKSCLKLKELFANTLALQQNNEEVLIKIRELSISVIGRDIFKREIAIIDGHDGSSYFWIKPVRVIDYTNTDYMENVAEMKSNEISIEEDDVNQYLTPFLYKYFDDELEANKKRNYACWVDDGNERVSHVEGFEWYLTHNFFTYDSIESILKDISDTICALSSGRETEYTNKLREKRGWATYQILYAKNLSEDQVKEYNANRPKEDDTKIELIIDFYHRFIYRMEYMMRVGKEKGYDLISFMGP